MTTTVGDMIRMLETIAPSELAEEWDNPGLQVGSGNWPVEKIWVALDPLPEVLSAACSQGVDLLVTHHPLIFRPLRRIDSATPMGRAVETALAGRLAVVSMHTNLDAAAGGLNDMLAERIGLTGLAALSRPAKTGRFKLVVFVPEDAGREVADALARTPAGRIGRYSACRFATRGVGSFRAEEGARPRVGRIGETTHLDEVRIETIVHKKDIDEVIGQLRKVHPYEEMAYDLYPLAPPREQPGIGRVGRLTAACRLNDLAVRIKNGMGLDAVRIAGDPDLKVRKVALCTGSGSSLMKAFMASGADAFVSGDLRYHDARDAEAAGRGLIDIGHFGSEHFMVEAVTERLKKQIESQGILVVVEACSLEAEPFAVL